MFECEDSLLDRLRKLAEYVDLDLQDMLWDIVCEVELLTLDNAIMQQECAALRAQVDG